MAACTPGGAEDTPATVTDRTIALDEMLEMASGLVVHVDDGDSLIVEIGDREERVRLIGINAPERGECLGDLARQALAERVEGQTVYLEADIEDSDRFERLLRYVWHDGELVNEWLAGAGLALARGFEPNTTRQPAIDAAGASARRQELGMWDPGACGPRSGGSFTLVEIEPNPPGRDEEDLNGEFVVLANTGTVVVDMTGWILRDGSSTNRFEFPTGFIARPDTPFTVAVGCGEDTDETLHWCHASPVWDNAGDEVLLTGPNGNVVLFESYQDEG
jgi:endonuclease YncB( thermonuclease family)